MAKHTTCPCLSSLASAVLHCSVFNPVSREWERKLSYTKAAQRETAYLSIAKAALSIRIVVPGRMNTRKPGTDARYRGNAERKAA